MPRVLLGDLPSLEILNLTKNKIGATGMAASVFVCGLLVVCGRPGRGPPTGVGGSEF